MELFLEGLPLKMREWEIRQIFEKYGKVHSVKLIFDLKTRKSRGFGFVEMPDTQQALHAISELNGVVIDDTTLLVKPARFTKNESKSTNPTRSEKPKASKSTSKKRY